ncbi:MAG: sulfotransferase domain-containing protein [Proteobacteria bacterium]|nr:sulfotransferase domain-containing protein [Pseudomonadota bacterium]
MSSALNSYRNPKSNKTDQENIYSMSSARPEQRYRYDNHHFLDGSRWDSFRAREGDIVVTTSMKAGTTWMMTIVANLLYDNGNFPAPVDVMAPWLDLRFHPVEQMIQTLEAQADRRFLKSHLPLSAMPYFEECRYIVVGRDTRDVFMSLVNHHNGYSDGMYAMTAQFDEVVGGPFPRDLGDIHEMWRLWMTTSSFANESDGYPYWSHLTHCQSWWDFKYLPNVHLVHFNDLLADPADEIKRIADFLSIVVDAKKVADVVDRVSFNRMQKDFDDIMPIAPMIWQNGAATFMNKGTNGRWKEVLNDQDLVLYEDAIKKVLSEDAAKWLANGRGG